MYIIEIACKEYKELILIINEKLENDKDIDAIEDLNDALKKYTHD